MPSVQLQRVLASSLHRLAPWRKVSPAANAAAPQIDVLTRIGARRGSTIDLTLTGKNLADPVGLSLTFAANAKFLPAKSVSTAATSLGVRLEIPTDAPLGLQSIRLATKRGISNMRFFCIDDLPEAVKQPGISKADKAQRIGHPVVVTGKAEKEVGDFYRFTAAAGSASPEVLGRRWEAPSTRSLRCSIPNRQECRAATTTMPWLARPTPG